MKTNTNKPRASEQSEFETLDEAWNALVEARVEIARLRNRLGEHDGCSRWGVKDAIALKLNDQAHGCRI